MNFEEFEDKFKPIAINNLLDYKKYYVSNTWPESRILLNYPNNQIWTIVKEDNKLFIKSGLHFENRVTNIITEVECNEKNGFYKIEIE